MNSDITGWRVIRTNPTTFAPVAYWAHDFDDAIKTISILGSRPKDYTIQRRIDGRWTDVPHLM